GRPRRRGRARVGGVGRPYAGGGRLRGRGLADGARATSVRDAATAGGCGGSWVSRRLRRPRSGHTSAPRRGPGSGCVGSTLLDARSRSRGTAKSVLRLLPAVLPERPRSK